MPGRADPRITRDEQRPESIYLRPLLLCALFVCCRLTGDTIRIADLTPRVLRCSEELINLRGDLPAGDPDQAICCEYPYCQPGPDIPGDIVQDKKDREGNDGDRRERQNAVGCKQ